MKIVAHNYNIFPVCCIDKISCVFFGQSGAHKSFSAQLPTLSDLCLQHNAWKFNKVDEANGAEVLRTARIHLVS